MKKRMILAGVIAAAATLVMSVINFFIGKITGEIIGFTFYGGEYSCTYGFGVKLEEFYPLSSADNPIAPSSHIEIVPLHFVLIVILLWVIIFLIWSLICKIKRTKAEI